MLRTIKKNSILVGFVSGITLTILTAGIIAFNVTSTSALSSEASANCTSHPTLRQGSRGACVTQLQRQLSDRGISVGGIDGIFGPKTEAAVLRLQQQSGISQDGIVGPQTWGVLDGGSSAPSHPAPTGVPSKCLRNEKTICIVKGKGSEATLYAIRNKEIQRAMPARTGDARSQKAATGEGSFRVFWKHIDHVSSIYDDAEMPYSMFFNGDQAIHYSKDFARCGYKRSCGQGGSSHGCVNLKSRSDASWLYDWSRESTKSTPGTLVIVTR